MGLGIVGGGGLGEDDHVWVSTAGKKGVGERGARAELISRLFHATSPISVVFGHTHA